MQSFLVSGCFHWIGFHIVNYLLESGYTVTGYERPVTDQQEHLEMMIGRNDLFSLFSSESPAERYTHAILSIGASEIAHDIKAGKLFQLSRENVQGGKGVVAIQVPLLFGEWMPMNEDGVYIGKQFIPFNSETFQNEAVYIGDFVATLMMCTMSSFPPEKLLMKQKNSVLPKKNNDSQIIFLRSQKQTEKQVQTVIEHYRRFRNFYALG